MPVTGFVASAVPIVQPITQPSPPARPSSACPARPPQTVRIGYEVHGTGPVKVLFVPGMCISRRMWDQQLRAFSRFPDVYSLCLMDNRGVGESDIPPAGFMDSRNANYNIETLAKDAWTVADVVFGEESKVHVAGWSMGSMIAQRMALQRLNRVASLALLSGNAGGWFWGNVPTGEIVHAAYDVARSGFSIDVSAAVSIRLHYTNAFLDEFVLDEATGKKRVRREQYLDRYRSGIKGDALKDLDGHAFWGHLAAVRGHNISKEEARTLRDAPFESLVIYGKDDAVVPPRASKDLAWRLGASKKAVAGAHMIIDESAHDVNQSLLELWKRCTADEPSTHPFEKSFLFRSLSKLRISAAYS